MAGFSWMHKFWGGWGFVFVFSSCCFWDSLCNMAGWNEECWGSEEGEGLEAQTMPKWNENAWKKWTALLYLSYYFNSKIEICCLGIMLFSHLYSALLGNYGAVEHSQFVHCPHLAAVFQIQYWNGVFKGVALADLHNAVWQQHPSHRSNNPQGLTLSVFRYVCCFVLANSI